MEHSEALAPATPATDDTENELVVELSKPFFFEGKEYTRVDLTGLDNLSARDLCDAEAFCSRKGDLTLMPAFGARYAIFVSSRATGLPIEFFESLPGKDSIKVQAAVRNFFY